MEWNEVSEEQLIIWNHFGDVLRNPRNLSWFKDALTADWYYPTLSKEVIKHHLSESGVGTFAVCHSTTHDNAFVVLLKVNQNEVRFFRIYFKSNEPAAPFSTDDGARFAGLKFAIDHACGGRNTRSL